MNIDDLWIRECSLESMRKCVSEWGIEGYSDKVCEICSNKSLHPMRDYLLALWREVYLGK